MRMGRLPLKPCPKSPEECPKCGHATLQLVGSKGVEVIKEGWSGPVYNSYSDQLEYTCGKCGYVASVKPLDYKEVNW